MPTIKTLVSILVVTIATAVNGATFKNCGSEATQGKVLSLGISGCPEKSSSCKLAKATSVAITVDFVPFVAAANLTLKVSALLVLKIEIPLLTTNACNGMGIQCPISPGKQYTGVANIPIKTSYPNMKGEVKGRLKDSNGNDIFCIITPIEIVSTSKSSTINNLEEDSSTSITVSD